MKLTTVTQEEVDALIEAHKGLGSAKARMRAFWALEDEGLPTDVDRLLSKRFGDLVTNAIDRICPPEVIRVS